MLGLIGSTGCGAISDWQLESRVRSRCEMLIPEGDPEIPAGWTRQRAINACFEGNLEQIRG